MKPTKNIIRKSTAFFGLGVFQSDSCEIYRTPRELEGRLGWGVAKLPRYKRIRLASGAHVDCTCRMSINKSGQCPRLTTRSVSRQIAGRRLSVSN